MISLMLLTALLPPGVLSFLGMIAVLAILWYCVKFLPEPAAQLKWLCYIVLLLILAYWVWVHTNGGAR